VLAKKFFDSGLIKGRLPGTKLVKQGLRAVGSQHLPAKIGKAERGGKTDVTHSEDGDFRLLRTNTS
jgi:hypothetical protein